MNSKCAEKEITDSRFSDKEFTLVVENIFHLIGSVGFFFFTFVNSASAVTS
jgi:hypothetical protein